MTNRLKPYRLISDTELNTVLHDMEIKLGIWNAQHALFPLTCSLNRQSKLDIIAHQVAILCAEHQAIALLMQTDLNLIKYCLLGDDSDCFNTPTETLFKQLLNELLGTTSLSLQTDAQLFHSEEWFYTGSPSLRLTLNTGSQSMTLYLHPQWVMTALPKPSSRAQRIQPYETALTNQSVELHVQLTPVTLRLEDVMCLRIGDVIKTDHNLTDPLLLNHQQHTVSRGELGTNQSYKSIQISRPL